MCIVMDGRVCPSVSNRHAMQTRSDNVTGKTTGCQFHPVDLTGKSKSGDVLVDLDVQLHAPKIFGQDDAVLVHEKAHGDAAHTI